MKDCAKIEKNFWDFLDDCNKITDYYINLRYPVHYQVKTKEQAREAIEIAERIIKFIQNKTCP